MSKVYLLEVDAINYSFVLGVFSSEQKVKDFLKENGTPVDEDSKVNYNKYQVFYSTSEYEVIVTELDMDKVHPCTSSNMVKKTKDI